MKTSSNVSDDDSEAKEGSNHGSVFRRNRFGPTPDYFSTGSGSGSFAGDDEEPQKPEFGRENPMVSSIEKLAQKRGTNTAAERFKVTPDYAYPNTRMNREELRREMNKRSYYFHELRLPTEPQGVGQVALEIMQCFGLPKPDSTLGSEASAFCIAVCGSHAFRTDTMPPVANPMWLARMRRACIFPISHAYARVYIGVFGQYGESRKDGFAGRIVLDISRLRPNCTYDITLPLRQSAHVYSRNQRGAIRVRIHLSWYSERQALLSYLPKKIPKIEPREDVAVHCCDTKSFQNVARVVHGDHMPGRFNVKHVRATAKEIQLTQIQLLRYLRKNEIRNLRQWRVPIISAFLFGAWMHCVYTESVSYVPGHFITFLLLYIWKNYAYYRIQRAPQNGFVAASWEEMFLALLFGRPNTIAPLEMQVSHEKPVMDQLVSINSSQTKQKSLIEIAKVFRAKMELHNGRQQMRFFENVFKGSEAVDFLVDKKFADSRDAAVALGRRLATELKLFECVMKHYQFMDEPWLYHFGNYDPNKYVIGSYKPRGKRFFRFLGLIPRREPTFAESQLEMPYTNSTDHPRFTVKESLVIRSKESMRMMEEEQEYVANDDGKSQSQQLEAGLSALLDDDEKSIGTASLDDLEAMEEEDPTKEVKILNKPPHQDINYKPKKPGMPLLEVLADARHKLHMYMGHTFNDRVYTVDTTVISQLADPKKSTAGRGKIRKFLSRKKESEGNLDDSVIRESVTSPKKIRDEYNRLLGTGKYSTSSLIMAKVGVLVQPINEMMLGVLCLFRAVFNLFTWRDPMLTFWVTIIGPVLVIILHCFPWRLVMGVAGVVLFGPQNWIIRVRRERLNGPDEFDPDRLVKKRKTPKGPEGIEVPLFSMYAPDNQPISNQDIDDSVVRKVLVPYSPFMYQRFYDFPPETEYARVTADDPPTVEQLDASRIASDRNLDGSSHSISGRSPFRRIRGLRKRRKQNTRKQDSMSSDGSAKSDAISEG